MNKEEKYKRLVIWHNDNVMSCSEQDTYMVEDVDMIIKEYKNLQQENKQLKRTLSATETNEETFRLEMQEITQILGLHEDTIFDDVKIYARYLVNIQNNWNKLKEWCKGFETKEFNYNFLVVTIKDLLDKMQELENGDSNE